MSVFEKEETFTLRVKQVEPLEPKEFILVEMLDYGEKLFNTKAVLLDRGFYSVPAIKELKSRNLDFIIPAKRNLP